MKKVAESVLRKLNEFDSPTVSNAIERLNIRPRTSGYAGHDLRCIFPELGTTVGYAVTCTADSTSEQRLNPRGLLPLWEAVDASLKPAILVIKDIGDDSYRSCHLGEVMATTAKALGAVGCICDGGLRDIHEIEGLGGFQLFCPGFVVSHGNPVICEVGVDVCLSGLEVSTGDILHGDINGVLTIPHGIVDQVADKVASVREEEGHILELVKSPNFTLNDLRGPEFRH
jgi:regulator of RNase E activity RraA